MRIRKIDSFRGIFSNMDGGEVLDVTCGEGHFIGILKTFLRS